MFFWSRWNIGNCLKKGCLFVASLDVIKRTFFSCLFLWNRGPPILFNFFAPFFRHSLEQFFSNLGSWRCMDFNCHGWLGNSGCWHLYIFNLPTLENTDLEQQIQHYHKQRCDFCHLSGTTWELSRAYFLVHQKVRNLTAVAKSGLNSSSLGHLQRVLLWKLQDLEMGSDRSGYWFHCWSFKHCSWFWGGERH